MNEQRQLTAMIAVLVCLYIYIYSIFARSYWGNEPADEPLLCYVHTYVSLQLF